MKASEHRARARDALKGKWLWAVLITLIASLLGGITDSGSVELDSFTELEASIDASFSEDNIMDDIDSEEVVIEDLNELEKILDDMDLDIQELPDALSWSAPLIITFVVLAAMFGTLVSIAFNVFVGGPVAVGYREYTLNLIDGNPADFGDVFSQFNNMGRAVKYKLLYFLITLGPTLMLIPVSFFLVFLLKQAGVMLVFLLIIGIIIFAIIASYSLQLGEYILADDANCTASNAIRMSWTLMEGERWRFFCLEMSFIGWSILAGFTGGIGNLFLNPYRQVSYASFYRELCPAIPVPVRQEPAENYIYEAITGPVSEPAPESDAEPVSEPAPESDAEPADESVPEPAPESVPESEPDTNPET